MRAPPVARPNRSRSRRAALRKLLGWLLLSSCSTGCAVTGPVEFDPHGTTAARLTTVETDGAIDQAAISDSAVTRETSGGRTPSWHGEKSGRDDPSDSKEAIGSSRRPAGEQIAAPARDSAGSTDPLVRPAAFVEPAKEDAVARAGAPAGARAGAQDRADAAPTVVDGRPVTLLGVLETVDGENPLINAARHRVEEAYAAWRRADVMWLPSLRAGLNYNKHEGRIQDVLGTNIETSRGAFYAGMGASAVGAGSPAVPGVYANYHLADAVFQPRAARHVATASEAGADSTAARLRLQAAQAYLELLRAEQETAIADEIETAARQLAELAESYAKTGQGLAADYDRLRTELSLRKNDSLRARETARVASARLAQLLRLDPATPLVPQEPALVPIHLYQSDEPVEASVATALVSRPELRESRALVEEAIERHRRERLAPFVPSVLLGVSQGGFGAGLGGRIDHFSDRLDTDAAAWWELRNFGFGEAAARGEAQARLEQARWREVAMLDQVAREVVEARAQVDSRKRQLAVGQEGVEVALSSYSKNLDRIRNGEGLPLEVLQSLQALAAARREYLRVVADYNSAQFTLQWALGADELLETSEAEEAAAADAAGSPPNVESIPAPQAE